MYIKMYMSFQICQRTNRVKICSGNNSWLHLQKCTAGAQWQIRNVYSREIFRKIMARGPGILYLSSSRSLHSRFIIPRAGDAVVAIILPEMTLPGSCWYSVTRSIFIIIDLINGGAGSGWRCTSERVHDKWQIKISLDQAYQRTLFPLLWES